MRIWKWEIRRVPAVAELEPRYMPPPDVAEMLLAKFPGADLIVRNERTGENVWLRPFRREGEISRGVGSVPQSVTLATDKWIEIKAALAVP